MHLLDRRTPCPPNASPITISASPCHVLWSKVEKSDSGVDPITHGCDCFVTAGRSPDLPDVASAKRKPTDLTQLAKRSLFPRVDPIYLRATKI